MSSSFSAIQKAILALLVLLTLLFFAFASSAQAKPYFKKCEGWDNAYASSTAQEKTMYCIAKEYRQEKKKKKLTRSKNLDEAAKMSTKDLADCENGKKDSCKKKGDRYFKRSGYADRSYFAMSLVANESMKPSNVAYAEPWQIFNSWMYSPTERHYFLQKSLRHFAFDMRVNGNYHHWSMMIGSGGKK